MSLGSSVLCSLRVHAREYDIWQIRSSAGDVSGGAAFRLHGSQRDVERNRVDGRNADNALLARSQGCLRRFLLHARRRRHARCLPGGVIWQCFSYLIIPCALESLKNN